MDCREVQERIIEGQVAPGLLSHLAACRDCEAFIRFHDRLLSPGAAPQAEPSAEVDVAVLLAACERLTAAPSPPQPSGKGAFILPFPGLVRRRVVRFAAAAVVAAGLMLAGLVVYHARQGGVSGAAGAGVTGSPLAWNYDPFEPGLLAAGLTDLEQHLGSVGTGRRRPSVEAELDRCAIELLLQEEEGTPEAAPTAPPAAQVMGSTSVACTSALLAPNSWT